MGGYCEGPHLVLVKTNGFRVSPHRYKGKLLDRVKEGWGVV